MRQPLLNEQSATTNIATPCNSATSLGENRATNLTQLSERLTKLAISDALSSAFPHGNVSAIRKYTRDELMSIVPSMKRRKRIHNWLTKENRALDDCRHELLLNTGL
jgi:hypothetical protein